jgi:hypothetical protein
MTTWRKAVCSLSLNEACTMPSGTNTESPAASVLDSSPRNCVMTPSLTMITSSWPG